MKSFPYRALEVLRDYYVAAKEWERFTRQTRPRRVKEAALAFHRRISLLLAEADAPRDADYLNGLQAFSEPAVDWNDLEVLPSDGNSAMVTMAPRLRPHPAADIQAVIRILEAELGIDHGHPDGPDEKLNVFWWEGVSLKIPSADWAAILRLLWQRKSATLAALVDAVDGTTADLAASRRCCQRIKRLVKWLRDSDLPLTISKCGESIFLEVFLM